MLVKCNSEGHSSSQMSYIIGHKCDGVAVKMENNHIMPKNGQMKLRQTIVGWSFYSKWKDGIMNRIALKILKESNPVNIAVYAVVCYSDQEPVFAW